MFYVAGGAGIAGDAAPLVRRYPFAKRAERDVEKAGIHLIVNTHLVIEADKKLSSS